MAARSPERKTRHLRSFGVLAALLLGLLALGLPAGRLKSFLDLPVDMSLQILSLDAMGDAKDILDLLSRVDEAERAAELLREREASLQALGSGVAPPVAYIVVRAGQQTRSGRPAAQDHTPPTTPRAVAATPLSDTSIAVAWEESQDDDAILGYEIIREGTAPFTASGARFTDSDLRPYTSYCYKVIAMDAAGNRSAEGGPACATTLDVLPPTSPDRIVATVQSPDTVTLTWAPSVDDAGSVVYEVLDGKEVVATVTEPTWTHSGAERRKHRYSARAVDRAGNRSVDAPPTLVSLADLEPPTTPADVKVASQFPAQMVVQWAASSDNLGVDRYDVLPADKVGAMDKVVASSRGTSAVVNALAEWQEHCFSVRAVDAEGNRSAPSAPVCGRTIERGAWEAARKNLGARTTAGAARTSTGGFYGSSARRRQEGGPAQNGPPGVDASSAAQ